MPALDPSTASLAELLPDDLVEVGAYPTVHDGEEHGLVVLALGRDYWLVPTAAGDAHRLLVETDAAALVRRHLAAYARERLSWPPAPIVDPWTARQPETIMPLLWAATVLAVHHFRGPWAAAGVLDSTAIWQRGELWRAVTSLFLHADAAHVISNSLAGVLVFSAVLSTIGRLRGWLLLAFASIGGNLAVAAVNHSIAYRSVGASTAIFAGVGLLSGRAIGVVSRTRHPHRWRAMFVPLAAGLTVLALHGAGGVRVDVGAHVCGFLAGTILGFAFARTAKP